MKKALLPVLFVTLALSGCGNNQPDTSDDGSEGTSITVDFTMTHTKVDDIPTTGDTKKDDFIDILNKYYFTNENITLTSFTGGYMNIAPGFKVTVSREFDQFIVLGSRTEDVDMIFVFTCAIKSVTFVCEAYSKYVSASMQNVDYDTYLTVNSEQKNISHHTSSDVDETQNLKYTVNSNQLRVQSPNTNSGDNNDKQGNRIILYKMILEY